MRLFKYVFAITLIALCSCDRDTEFEGGGEEQEIIIPTGDYIFFDLERVTRGTSIVDYLRDEFSVLGYKYTGEWKSAKSQATQNANGVFDTKPQKVTWNGTVHTYTPIKEWDVNSTYSFFAWYPHNLSANGGNSTINTHVGNPYITYSLGDDISDPSKHIDVLTAYIVDQKVDLSISSTKSVALRMHHRLSKLNLVAASYVNAESVGLDKGVTANVKIAKLDLILDNLLYDGVKIPLNEDPNTTDATDKMVGTNARGSKTVTYSNLVTNKTLDYYNKNVGPTKLTEDKDIKNALFLIPQNEALSCKAVVTYDIVDDNGSSLWDDIYEDVLNAPDKTQEATIFIDKLESGVPYAIQLIFTKSGVTANVIQSLQWEDTNVNHEFE